MNPLSAVYGQVARLRRNWYEQHPERQRHLGCPVVSVGNLVVGGSGKTPVVSLLAGLLQAAGYRPAILSRGYKRRSRAAVVVVSDDRSVQATVEASGDEPQMLARRLPGVPVVVSADRYRAGSLARQRFGTNVLILDDGFQHVQVARTVNLLLLSAADLSEQVLPAGRLREPLDAAVHADAVLVPAESGEPSSLARELAVEHAFAVTTVPHPLRTVTPFGGSLATAPTRVVTVSAIARPERFVDAVRASGFTVAQQFTYRDHHWFSADDVSRIEQAARDAGVDAIVTTEKDAVRLESVVTGSVPFLFLPIEARIEPAGLFRAWLLERIGPPGAPW